MEGDEYTTVKTPYLKQTQTSVQMAELGVEEERIKKKLGGGL